MKDIYEILEKMAAYEDKIMELYWEFADKFQAQAETWNTLAEEEKGHAFMIRGLTSAIKTAELEKSFFRFDVADIEKAAEGIEREIKRSRESGYTAKDAFTAAVDLEKWMIESRIFDSFDTTDPQLKKVLEKLQKDTERHFNRLKAIKPPKP